MEAIGNWLQTQLGFSVVLMFVILNIMLGATAYCIFFERKVAAATQDRYGPNRVGPWGLLQSIADGLKMLFKEDVIPGNVDKVLYLLAPMMAFSVALLAFAVIPWGGWVQMPNGTVVAVQGASLNIGLLYVLAVGSLGVYGIVIGGWASNNKYSFYGAMRAAAQMLSYEIPLGLAILVVVLSTGQLRLENIVVAQSSEAGGAWIALLHPVAFIVLVIASLAEANRAPFDLAECEQELVGGFHTEYSALKFGLFFLGEYAHMITASAFISVLFLGGWELFPFSWALGWGWIDWINQNTSVWAALVRVAILLGKVVFFMFLFMWVRWTLPRFRFDQLMAMAWKGLIPLTTAVVVLAGVLVYVGKPVSIWAPIGDVVIVLLMYLWASHSPTPVSGRQSTLPPITARGGSSG